MQKPCYAVVRKFDILKYNLGTEQIIAENKTGRVLIDYFPVSEDAQQQVAVTASRIEADFVETASGQYKLWSFLAKDGISFKDENSHLEGDKLFYNDTTSVITVNGNKSYPAYYNGVLFDNFEYNMTTGELKPVEIKGSGILSSRR